MDVCHRTCRNGQSTRPVGSNVSCTQPAETRGATPAQQRKRQQQRLRTWLFSNSDLVFAKGVYPYFYMTGLEKFGETQLPPIEAFYNTLDEEALTQEDYERAKKIWAHYK